MIVRLLCVVCLALTLAACGDPRETPLPANLAEPGEAVTKAAAKLSEEERKLLTAYVARRVMGEGLSKVFGKDLGEARATTIGEAISQQRAWAERVVKQEAEAAALKAKLQAEQDALRQQVAGAVTVTVVELKVVPKDIHASRFSDSQMIRLGFENKSGKDIAGIKGSVRFIDMFDAEIDTVGFSYDGGIAAGATATWTGVRDINQFERSHKALAQIEPGKYKTTFDPEMIVFKDGTRLSSAGKTP